LTISTCPDGVKILSALDLASGKNMANDAAYTLARALLAARLNQDAGACVPMGTYGGLTFEEVLDAADNLLTQVGFDGTGGFLGRRSRTACS